MNIILAKDISRRFGQRWAYARVSLELKSKERLLLIGANGSGKTTLLRSFSTLLTPSVGELFLFGQSVMKGGLGVRHKIGLVSHNVGLYEDLSASENLQLFARLMGKSLSHEESKELLSSVGLEFRTEPVRNYSAGMRKRVSIASLKLKRPELVLLDEPFSALDPTGMDELSELIIDLNATIVIASHQVERAAALCQRALLLEDGLVRWSGVADKAWKAWRMSQQRST